MELITTDTPKMLRETLCVAQQRVYSLGGDRTTEHGARLQRLIDECDRHRPLGDDGQHGDLHTATCGCEIDKINDLLDFVRENFGPLEKWQESFLRAVFNNEDPDFHFFALPRNQRGKLWAFEPNSPSK